MRNEQNIHRIVTRLKMDFHDIVHPTHYPHKNIQPHRRVLAALGLSSVAVLSSCASPQVPTLPTDSSHNPLPTPTETNMLTQQISATATLPPREETATQDVSNYNPLTNTITAVIPTLQATETPTQTKEVTTTQETATPTELGTLAKVKFGKTEITAGVDITFMVNLFGTMTPVRLVASHDIAGIQADTWYTQTINGQTPQELLRRNIEDMLNARPTKNVWELTNGHGLKGTDFTLKPNTEIVLIVATQQNIRDSAVPWDPMANNFKFAAEYDPKANELRMMTAGASEYNIPDYLKQYPGYRDQVIESQIYSDLSDLMMVYPPVADAVVMKPDSHQLELYNSFVRAFKDHDGYIHSIQPKD